MYNPVFARWLGLVGKERSVPYDRMVAQPIRIGRLGERQRESPTRSSLEQPGSRPHCPVSHFRNPPLVGNLSRQVLVNIPDSRSRDPSIQQRHLRIVERYGVGFLVPFDDPSAVVDAVAELENEEVRARCAANGRRLVAAEFDWRFDAAVMREAYLRAVT